MIKIEFNSPLNYGETVYFLDNNKVYKGTLSSIGVYDDSNGTRVFYVVTTDNIHVKTLTEVYTSQEELFKAIMLKEDTDEKEAIGK